MTISLNDALHNSPYVLGDHFEHLGSSTGCSKLYLSYDEVNGWSVQDLNIFWQIIRFLFSCFQETHLHHVVGRLSQEASIPEELKNRILEIWQRVSPLASCPELRVQTSPTSSQPNLEMVENETPSLSHQSDPRSIANQIPTHADHLNLLPKAPFNQAISRSTHAGHQHLQSIFKSNPIVQCPLMRASVRIEVMQTGFIGDDKTYFYHKHLTDEHNHPYMVNPDDFYLSLGLTPSDVDSEDLKHSIHLPASLFRDVNNGGIIRFKWDGQLMELSINQSADPVCDFQFTWNEIRQKAEGERYFLFESDIMNGATVFDHRYLSESACLLTFVPSVDNPTQGSLTAHSDLEQLWNRRGGWSIPSASITQLTPQIVRIDTNTYVIYCRGFLGVEKNNDTDLQILWDNNIVVIQAKALQYSPASIRRALREQGLTTLPELPERSAVDTEALYHQLISKFEEVTRQQFNIAIAPELRFSHHFSSTATEDLIRYAEAISGISIQRSSVLTFNDLLDAIGIPRVTESKEPITYYQATLMDPLLRTANFDDACVAAHARALQIRFRIAASDDSADVVLDSSQRSPRLQRRGSI